MIYLRSTIGVHRDIPLVKHFINYYQHLGVNRFLFTLHSHSQENQDLSEARSVLQEFNIQPVSIWVTRRWTAVDNTRIHREMVAGISGEAWIVTADIDEFHEFPMHLTDFVRSLEGHEYNIVKGMLIQRVARDFRLHSLKSEPDIHSQFPLEADFHIGQLSKIMLHRNSLLTNPGHHLVDSSCENDARFYPGLLKVGHFKWFAGVEEKYTNPDLIAHHGAAWEYSAYESFIKQNFHGWRRVLNSVIFSTPLSPILLTARRIKSVFKKWL